MASRVSMHCFRRASSMAVASDDNLMLRRPQVRSKRGVVRTPLSLSLSYLLSLMRPSSIADVLAVAALVAYLASLTACTVCRVTQILSERMCRQRRQHDPQAKQGY